MLITGIVNSIIHVVAMNAATNGDVPNFEITAEFSRHVRELSRFSETLKMVIRQGDWQRFIETVRNIHGQYSNKLAEEIERENINTFEALLAFLEVCRQPLHAKLDEVRLWRIQEAIDVKYEDLQERFPIVEDEKLKKLAEHSAYLSHNEKFIKTSFEKIKKKIIEYNTFLEQLDSRRKDNLAARGMMNCLTLTKGIMFQAFESNMSNKSLVKEVTSSQSLENFLKENVLMTKEDMLGLNLHLEIDELLFLFYPNYTDFLLMKMRQMLELDFKMNAFLYMKASLYKREFDLNTTRELQVKLQNFEGRVEELAQHEELSFEEIKKLYLFVIEGRVDYQEDQCIGIELEMAICSTEMAMENAQPDIIEKLENFIDGLIEKLCTLVRSHERNICIIYLENSLKELADLDLTVVYRNAQLIQKRYFPDTPCYLYPGYEQTYDELLKTKFGMLSKPKPYESKARDMPQSKRRKTVFFKQTLNDEPQASLINLKYN